MKLKQHTELEQIPFHVYENIDVSKSHGCRDGILTTFHFQCVKYKIALTEQRVVKHMSRGLSGG